MAFSLNFRSTVVAVTIGVAAFLAAPAEAAPMRPVIVFVPIGSNPPVPAGLKVACMQGPNILTMSKTCPVVKYLGNTTWAYSFIDNRVSMALVTYDAQNNVVNNITKDGARYIWQEIVNPGDQTVNFQGQANQSVSATYDELFTPSPLIVAVAANSHPPVPAGLKVTCMNSGTSLNPSPTCPVVKYKGITTWAYSFIDNRVSMAFVSYDAQGNVVRNVTMDGARYVWQITASSGTVTATGQSDQSVSAPYSQFGP